MKLLQKEFTMNADRSGDQVFKQLRKESGVALYERLKDGRHYDYEVFVIKTIAAGTPLPNGKKVEVTYEQYPGAAQWGKSAWSPVTLEQANVMFDNVVAKLQSEVGQPKRRGRKSKITKEIVLPRGKFTMKALIAKTGLTQPVLYLRLQKLVKSGTVIEVGRIKTDSGRGRLAVIYKAKA